MNKRCSHSTALYFQDAERNIRDATYSASRGQLMEVVVLMFEIKLRMHLTEIAMSSDVSTTTFNAQNGKESVVTCL